MIESCGSKNLSSPADLYALTVTASWLSSPAAASLPPPAVLLSFHHTTFIYTAIPLHTLYTVLLDSWIQLLQYIHSSHSIH
jgi:hypothetical protein